jgi:hypothetical protein
VPSNKIRLKIQVMKPFDTVFASQDKILDNEFNPFTDLVEYGAAIKAKGRSDEGTDPLTNTFFRRLSHLHQWLESRSRTGYARVVTDGY